MGGVKGKTPHRYTDEEKTFLREITPGRPYKEIWRRFNERFGLELTFSQVDGALDRLGLRNGRDGRFPPGYGPCNKGKPSPWAWKSAATQFKPGSIPPNRREVGEERISKDGYVEVKIADGRRNKNWAFKHVMVWEDAYGKVPKGCAIIFKDGDKRNFELDNLACVTRGELLRLNQLGLIKNDAALTEAGILIAKIANKRRKTDDKPIPTSDTGA